MRTKLHCVLILAFGLCLTVSSVAKADAVVVDLAQDWVDAMTAFGQTDDFNLDNNGPSETTPPAYPNPNGIMDKAELALVGAILGNGALNLSSGGGVTHVAVHSAWNSNLVIATAKLASLFGGSIPSWAEPVPPYFDGMILVSAEEWIAGQLYGGSVGDFLAAGYDLTQRAFLTPDGDADGDGATNQEEWDFFGAPLAPAQPIPPDEDVTAAIDAYVAAALDPNVFPPSAPSGGGITCNVSSGFIEAGMLIRLTGPAGTGYEWRKGGATVFNTDRITGANSQTLVLDPVAQEDAGSYVFVYDDGTKTIIMTAPFVLEVLAPGSLPVVGIIGLWITAAGCAAGALAALRRQRGKSAQK